MAMSPVPVVDGVAANDAQPSPDAASAQGMAAVLSAARIAQKRWAAMPMAQRLVVLRRLRSLIAQQAESLAATVPLNVPGSLHRTVADTLVAEVLPLAEACRYLERNAATVLAARSLPGRGRPFFLRGVEGVVERVPLGVVLVIAPANYPLFLPAVQGLQALAAGNAVLWKPAVTGADAARRIAGLLDAAGLPSHLVTVLDTDVDAARSAIAAGVDKVVLTGHVATGRKVLHALADTLTPAVMELSGYDAVFLLPGADLEHAVRAIAFGLRLNGSATCMAPRRLFLVGGKLERCEALLVAALRSLPPIPLPAGAASELASLIEDAERQGARILLNSTGATGSGPVLVADATPRMRVMQADIFAPLLSTMRVPHQAAARQAYAACPYALTASVFGPERDATAFARTLCAGTVLINDVIVATADPRLPFGGRGQSGFGTTRGAEGLLEMTAVRSLVTQRSRDSRTYMPTTAAHTPFFSAYIRAVHSSGWAERLKAMRALAAAARHIKASENQTRTGKH